MARTVPVPTGKNMPIAEEQLWHTIKERAKKLGTQYVHEDVDGWILEMTMPGVIGDIWGDVIGKTEINSVSSAMNSRGKKSGNMLCVESVPGRNKDSFWFVPDVFGSGHPPWSKESTQPARKSASPVSTRHIPPVDKHRLDEPAPIAPPPPPVSPEPAPQRTAESEPPMSAPQKRAPVSTDLDIPEPGPLISTYLVTLADESPSRFAPEVMQLSGDRARALAINLAVENASLREQVARLRTRLQGLMGLLGDD